MAAPLPERQNVPILPRFGGQIEQRAVEGCTIIVGKIDKARLLNKPAQFNQVTGALPASHHPPPRIGAALISLGTAKGTLRSHHCLAGCGNLTRELSSRAVERMLHPSRATPPLFPRQAFPPLR